VFKADLSITCTKCGYQALKEMLQRQGTHAMLHSALHANQNRNASRCGLVGSQASSSLTSLASIAESCDSIRPLPGSQEMYDNWNAEVGFRRSSLPIWEGRLKQKKSQLFGSDTWRDRYVRLDPKAGLLSIWSVRDGEEPSASSSPKKQFALDCVRGVDSNRHHLDIMILFSHKADSEKVKYALQFRAETSEEYTNWMFVLGHFGMRHDIMGVEAKLRGQLTRAFSVMTLDAVDDVQRCSADDTASEYSHAASESTTCSVQTLDDDALRNLCDVLQEVSPCNKEWCETVGLECGNVFQMSSL